jgi:endoglucanase
MATAFPTTRREILRRATAAIAVSSVSGPPGQPGAKTIPAAAACCRCQFGVNLAAKEFDSKSVPTAAELDYYRSRGIRTFRLPLRWELLQPKLTGPLDTSYIDRFKPLIDHAASHAQKVLLDIHNFGRYDSVAIGSDRVPVASFADLWARLASTFSGHPGLEGYDIMNEPHDMPTPQTWPMAAQAAVDVIRRVDSVTPIYVEGDGWANAADWLSDSHLNSTLNIRDPADSIIYSAHVYADSDSTGIYKKPFAEDGATTATLIDRFRAFERWLRQRGLRGHVGECGVPADPGWLACLDALLAYLSRGTDIAQFHYWVGGPGWEDYALSIEPINGVDRPQMRILAKYIGSQ